MNSDKKTVFLLWRHWITRVPIIRVREKEPGLTRPGQNPLWSRALRPSMCFRRQIEPYIKRTCMFDHQRPNVVVETYPSFCRLGDAGGRVRRTSFWIVVVRRGGRGAAAACRSTLARSFIIQRAFTRAVQWTTRTAVQRRAFDGRKGARPSVLSFTPVSAASEWARERPVRRRNASAAARSATPAKRRRRHMVNTEANGWPPAVSTTMAVAAAAAETTTIGHDRPR